jgi:hypothetical protein
MSDGRAEILNRALAALAQGQSVESILAAYPDAAAELGPLVEAARAAASLRTHDVPSEAVRRSRRRFLTHGPELLPPQPWWRRAAVAAPRRAATSLAILVVAVLGAGGITSAAAQALPGDVLYPVKLAAEDLALLLSADNHRRLELETVYADRRVEEVVRLLGLGRVVPLSFEGVVSRTGPVIWIVGGVSVRLTPETRILGEILPGMIVEVEGLTQTDGTFLAHELHLHQYDLLARLEAMTGDRLVVGGVELGLTPASWLEPGLAVGDLVLVRVAIADSGERSALSVVRFLPPTPTPLPPSPTPPPTPRPSPTATPTNDNSGPGGAQDDDGDDDDADDDEGEEIQFEGTVESIGGGQWVVSGRTLRITSDTEIRDDPKIGDRVKVKAEVFSDGTWVALRIERED